MTSPFPFPADPSGAVLSLDDVRVLTMPLQAPVGPLPTRVQVVVVGAGPAGLTAANLLGQYGIDTLVLDARPSVSDQPKAIAIDDEYMRLLASLGLGRAIERHHSAPFGIWFMGANRKPVIKVKGAETSNGFGRRCAVMQPVFEQILLAGALGRECVNVRFDASVDAVSQDTEGAEVRVGDQLVRCDYLLGCDGAGSFVRTSMGAKLVGSRIDEPHLVVDLADFPDQVPYSRFFCDPRRPFNSVPSVYGGRRIEFMLNPDDNQEFLLSDAGVQHLVDRHTPYAGADLQIIRRAIYGFSEKIADHLQIGRVFLLGDAAHVMPPFGGQGMNTAARDANNLCWKIAAVLQKRASEQLLKSYDPERRPQISSIVKYSVLVGRFANIRSKPLAFLRDAFFRATQFVPGVRQFFGEMRYMPRPRILADLLGPVEDRFKSMIGVTFPRWILLSGPDIVTVDDLAGDGFALVGIDVPAEALLTAARHPLWAGKVPCLIALSASDRPAQFGVASARFHGGVPGEGKLLQGAICVVRPDRYTASIFTPETAMVSLDKLARTAS
jgi:3-(3-hydroxy-phenyl)propionate hydroxylase